MKERTTTGSLAGRHIVITGGSSGIGRASGIAVANRGATVFLLARRENELDEVVSEIREGGNIAFGYPCDITDPTAVTATVERILATHGHVDMLVNNAGRSIRRSVYRSTDRLHDYQRTMAVNYFGAVAMTLALLPHFRERKQGHVVNISSAGVQISMPRYSAYLASKAALDKFTDVVAAETLADRITFTTVHMPLVDTPMIAPSGRHNAGPAASPEWAATMVVRALTERPKRIDMPAATIAEYGALIAPRLKDVVMHRLYRQYPETPAAKGEANTPDEDRRPTGLSVHVGRAAARLGKFVPGAQW